MKNQDPKLDPSKLDPTLGSGSGSTLDPKFGSDPHISTNSYKGLDIFLQSKDEVFNDNFLKKSTMLYTMKLFVLYLLMFSEF